MAEAAPETYAYSLGVNSAQEARDVVARFETPAMVGPMASECAEAVARLALDITNADADTRIWGPIVPIDPVSNRPNYEQTEPRVLINTKVDESTLSGMLHTHEQAIMAERTN